MVGSALVRRLGLLGFNNLLLRTRKELDLTSQNDVLKFFSEEKPDYILLSAAKVGGIKANKENPADFLHENLMIQSNIYDAALKTGVKKILFLGSSCIYPKDCPQPMKENYLFTGPLEPTNEGYAIAKIAGLKLGQYFFDQYGLETLSLIPCNLYGPNDSFDPEHSHVLSALVKKFEDAKDKGVESVTLWGTGEARREFLHVDDLARIAIDLMNNYSSNGFINVGSGYDVSIKELAEKIASIIGFEGKINWDDTMPNGMLKKCMDISKMMELGYKPEITLEQGILGVVNDYKKIKNS